MDNIMLDTSHSVSITRWLLRAVNSPILNAYITEKPHTFAVFFSLLNDKVKWTKAFNSLIESAIEENAGDFSSEKYKEFNSRLLTMNPNLHSFSISFLLFNFLVKLDIALLNTAGFCFTFSYTT